MMNNLKHKKIKVDTIDNFFDDPLKIMNENIRLFKPNLWIEDDQNNLAAIEDNLEFEDDVESSFSDDKSNFLYFIYFKR